MPDKLGDKQFWYTLAGMAGAVLVLYVVELTFVSVSARQRTMIGTALQLLTGLIFGADQVVANLHLNSNEDIWDLMARRRMKISLLVCQVLSLGAVLYWLATSGTKVTLLSVYFAIATLAVLYYPYMYEVRQLISLLDKIPAGRNAKSPMTFLALAEERESPLGSQRDQSSKILWANMILLGLSVSLILLAAFLVKPQPGHWISILLWILVVCLMGTTVVLSLGFFVAAGVISFFAFVRQRVKRSVFWLVLLGLWSWGGLLLLADVLAH